MRHPAERHAPGFGDSGADAIADRRGERALRGRVDHHAQNVRLHKPHRPPRGARAMARQNARKYAPTTPPDYLSHQRPPSSGGCQGFPQRLVKAPRNVAYRGGWREGRVLQ